MIASLRGEWTETYIFSSLQEDALRDGLCCMYDTPHFRQLICSWNAQRPGQGTYLLRGRVRNAHTHRWSSWHDMMEWGAGVQRSFHRSHDADVEHMYVRLESTFVADGFEVYIQPRNGATLRHIHGVCVNISHHDRMECEASHAYAAYPSIAPLAVPQISQKMAPHEETDRICSPTSLTMLLQYMTLQPINVAELAEASFDNGFSAYGSWPFNIAAGYQYMPSHMGLYVHRLPRFHHLYQYLKAGTPVIISVRGRITGAPQNYPHGHLIVVIGLDTSCMKLICADPAMSSHEDVHVFYPLHDVLRAWERSHRLVYTVEM